MMSFLRTTTLLRSTMMIPHARSARKNGRKMTTGLPGDRLPVLKRLLDQQRLSNSNLPLRILETHSGLTGLIAEHAVGEGGHQHQFDGMWSSSLTASAVRGMPDIEAVDTTARLALVKETLYVTTKPMIYDGDTGGLPDIFKFTVRSLEQIGVSAVILEDKQGLKRNSLLENSNSLHQLVDIDEFCDKIRAGLEARRNPDFMIIARMESLIAGRPMEEALSRARACVVAGASGIMIHSRQKEPDEVMEFLFHFRNEWGPSIPVVVVPTSYSHITEQELGEAGASICIYANHLLRASYPTMNKVAESILTHSRSYEAEQYLMPIKAVTSFIDHDDKKSAKPYPDKPKDYGMVPEVNGYHHQMLRANFSTAAAATNLHDDDDDDDDKEESATLDSSNNQVSPSRLLDCLTTQLGVSFFTGVPDSCIKTFCAEIDQRSATNPNMSHAIAANEGAAVALAVGNYLATGKVPMVYMQNSGLGNATNPILSAAHQDVYSIPMVLVIGWRGSPGQHDEPQHVVQGRQTKAMLEVMNVETFVLPKNDAGAEKTLLQAHNAAQKGNCPVAVLVRPNTFSGKVVEATPKGKPTTSLTREQALSHVLDVIGPSDAVVATTGFTSRELYELREAAAGSSHDSDFLCVGSMGHAIAIAQGVAMGQPERVVWCIDGDGASLMHMGSLALSSSFGLGNLRHVLVNNEAHESVGGQKTAASQRTTSRRVDSSLDFMELASSVGYKCTGTAARTVDDLKAKLSRFAEQGPTENASPTFLEIKVSTGTRSDLGRPKSSTRSTRDGFMAFCKKTPVPRQYDSLSIQPTSNVDPILLTPGPLSTSTSVKRSMMHDYGSRDRSFVELTGRVRQQLVNVLEGTNADLSAILLQGSGTFAVEAMINQFVSPESGKLLILCNGAYGRRMGSICEASGRSYDLIEGSENEPLNLDYVKAALDSNPHVTHVAVVSCETTTGVLNPVSDIANAVESRGKRLLIDAMSSFGVIDLDANVPFDAIAASSNKGLQGSPGLGFVIVRKQALEETAGNSNTISLDLYSQWRGFETSGEWRFTPPTHCLLALSQALEEFEAEGGTHGRRCRYKENCKILVDGMRSLGFETIVPDDSQAPVIVTFRMPSDPLFEFQTFYDRLASRGYVIYPGKLAAEPSFRVGCIGHVFPADMSGFVEAAQRTLDDMGVSLLSSQAS